MQKREKPVAVCTRCGRTTRSVTAINQACGNIRRGRRCSGSWGSALAVGDWRECPSCSGTGHEGLVACSQCSGDGWLYVRGRIAG
jgi:hypothetical protein